MNIHKVAEEASPPSFIANVFFHITFDDIVEFIAESSAYVFCQSHPICRQRNCYAAWPGVLHDPFRLRMDLEERGTKCKEHGHKHYKA